MNKGSNALRPLFRENISQNLKILLGYCMKPLFVLKGIISYIPEYFVLRMFDLILIILQLSGVTFNYHNNDNNLYCKILGIVVRYQGKHFYQQLGYALTYNFYCCLEMKKNLCHHCLETIKS